MTRRLLPRALFAVLALAPASARAADTPRYAHSATMLPNGDVLVAGGINAAGAFLNTAEVVQTSRDGSPAAILDTANNMPVARASHTATLLPDGRVLVAGGWDGAAVLNSAAIYDPGATPPWSPVAASMQQARFNHTATLLNDGRVLICGGQTSVAAPAVTDACEFFDSVTEVFTAHATGLQQARALHASVLLKDGKVWFGGGWNPAISPNYLQTTERYDPALDIFNSAAPLSQARAYHTATLMGHGKVLIAGGYNGDNSAITGNSYGILRTAEIYDPVANTMIPAASMAARREMHSAVLLAENVVLLEGGLGNIATTYLAAGDGLAANFEAGGFITNGLVAVPQGNITGGALTLVPDISLGTEISGTIENGEIWLSSPQVSLSGAAEVDFTPASPSNPAVGLRISLNGVRVGCDEAGVCGKITAPLALSNLQGSSFFSRISNAADISATPAILAPGDAISFDQTIRTSGPTTANITAGAFTVRIRIAMPVQTVGANILASTYRVATPYSASLSQPGLFSVTVTDADVTLTPTGPVALNADGNGGVLTADVRVTINSGLIQVGDTPADVTSPQSLDGAQLDAISGVMRYVADRLDMAGAAFTVDVATVVIRRMVLGSPAYYNPGLNQWSFVRPGRQIESVGDPRTRFGGTSTLLVNNDVLTIGGRECDDASPTCASFAPKTDGSGRDDRFETVAWKNWYPTDLGMEKRVFHTATNLPDGTILVAGGSNGPNILRSAEIFDPRSETRRATSAPMHDARDLHTATLLPNGRVLLAGGFTTNATSTGSTSASEIYYPDTAVFLRAGVMFSSRSNHTASLLPDGNVLVAGGFGTDDVITATAEIFYSTAMAWRQTTGMPAPRALHTATTLKDGRIMLAGGVNADGVLASVVAFDPATGLWSALALMPGALHSHTATLMTDGRVLVAGGNDGLGEADATYIYDPAGDFWLQGVASAGTFLTQPRFGHNAVMLPNGNVVISGGSQRFGALTELIEQFHPTQAVWISTSGVTFGSGNSQISPRSYHTMTLAVNNMLYAIGGADGAIGGQGTRFPTSVERAYFTAYPDMFMPNPTTPFQSPRQSTITATSASPFLPNTLFTVTGDQFRGGTEAGGGGAGPAHSSFSFPRLVLQSLDGSGGPGSQSNSGFIVDLTTQIYLNPGNLSTLNTSLTVQLPATSAALPYGWYHARVGANDIYSNPVAVQVGPAKPASAPAAPVPTALGTSSVSWTWGAVAGADGYNVYQSSTGVLVATSAATTFIQDGLAPNTTASIRVAAYTLTGDGPLAQGATAFTLCSAPAGVTIASVTPASLLLYWDVNGNQNGTVYEVSQSTDGFVSAPVSTPVPAGLVLTTNYYTIGNLVEDTLYSFRVRAYNGVNAPGPFSAVVSTLTPAGVNQLAGGATSATTIRWSWMKTNTATSYRVYNATTGVLLAVVAPIESPMFDDTGLGFNQPRSVLVSAVSAAGEGPLSPSPTVYTLAEVPAAGAPPYAAAGFTESSLTPNWSLNGNPSYTQYSFALFPVGSSIPVGGEAFGFVPLDGSVSSRTVEGLTPATLYVASITAVNGNGIESASWLVMGATYTYAARPGQPQVTAITAVSAAVSWDQSGNGPAATYEVTYSTDGGFSGGVSTAVPFSSDYAGSTATITGLLTSTTYYIRVRAQTPFGRASSPSLNAVAYTDNGGAPPGALAGKLAALSASQITGTIAGGRLIDVRSPAGAFPGDVTMTISTYDVVGTLCPDAVNVALQITNAPAFQPSKPVFLSFSYAPAELGGIPASRAVLLRYEPLSRACVPLETRAAGGTITAQINHFSLFQLGQVALAVDPGRARVFPNPFRAASDGYVTIDNVPPASRVRVFTLRGEPVADMTANASGIATWRADNASGRSVASGLYLVMVEHGSSRKILKLSVIR